MQQVHPESNELVEKAFTKTLATHSEVDCIIYDRNCSFANNVKDKDPFKKVKYWPIDKWHGYRHTSGCKHSPKNVARYRKRLAKVNCSVCEQTFSWFRNYARTMNEMRPARQEFLIMLYVKWHNELIASGETSHLSGLCSPDSHRGGHYACAE